MELIDRQSALSVCKEYCWTDDEVFIAGYNTAIKDTEVKLSKLPTIEAEPVRHGQWKYGYCEEAGMRCYFCTTCGKEAYWDTDYGQQLFDFCQNCGSKMDGGDDNGKVD